MSITELSDAMDKGYLTSELLVTLYLERISTYNEEFNAIREINDNALEEARALDIEREEGNTRSILHGIPIIVKTNINVLGLATTGGSKALSDNYPLEDAEVIKKLKDAGAIILASANMSEFAFSASNSYSSYGQVKNVFNPQYSPYGSSGGSAVSVAASFAAASLGTDTNSSVRLPAVAAGLVGLRPTFGLVSSDGVLPYDILRDTVGILSKTVEDNAIILSVINDEDKSYEVNTNVLDGLRIGVVKSYLEGNGGTGANSKTNESIVKLAKEKLQLLEDNGVELVYIDELLNSTYLNYASSTMTGGSFCDGFNEYIETTTGKIRSFKDLTYSSSKVYDLTGYYKDCNGVWKSSIESKDKKKESFKSHVDEVMETNGVDVLVYPTTKKLNLKLDESGLGAPGSTLGSVIGYPSITVPIGFIDEFSYGLEFFTYQNNENFLYDVAGSFEELMDLSLTNSPLTPALYTVPDVVEELKQIYEEYYDNEYYQELTADTREYFTNYSSLDDEELESLAVNLINEYKTFVPKTIKSKKGMIEIFITITIILVLIICEYMILRNKR